MNLYRTLKVRKTATTEEIEKAYRKLARTHHPDRGGDEAKFREIQLAYDVLIDTERRTRYDTTGDTSTIPVFDPRIGNAIGLISNVYCRLIVDLMKHNQPPTTEDLLHHIKLSIGETVKNIMQEIEGMGKCKATMEKTLGRFKKKGDPKDNCMEGMVKNNIHILEVNIRQMNQQLENCNLALEILKDYLYKRDEQVQYISSVVYWSVQG